jgi:hypothetical protein
MAAITLVEFELSRRGTGLSMAASLAAKPFTWQVYYTELSHQRRPPAVHLNVRVAGEISTPKASHQTMTLAYLPGSTPDGTA